MTADSPAGSPASDAGVSTDAPKLSPALVPGWTGADHWQALELAKPGRDEPFYINRLARAFLLVVHDLRAERSRLRSLSEENARLTAENTKLRDTMRGCRNCERARQLNESYRQTLDLIDKHKAQAALAVRPASPAPGETATEGAK